MVRIKIKPISVNRAYKGRRFSTPEHKAFEEEFLLLLPRGVEIPKGKLCLAIAFGVSSKNADLDNLLKVTIDVLQQAYEFNDKRIYIITASKEDVKKGEEYINFNIFSA